MRPLPAASDRPVEKGAAFYVDARRGDDANDGSEAKPWRTIQHALKSLQPGATLYLRGGIFHERLRVTSSGEKGRPITIRGYPGELAVLDGGIPEFLENPAACWEPAPGGASHEYVSQRTFPEWGERARIAGHFDDSMVPLHGYIFLQDVRAAQDGIWRVKSKDDSENGVYCGPGIWFDQDSKRFRIRLAPTRFDWLGEANNYRGETDPRKIPLVIAGGNAEGLLTLRNARHLRFQDLVLRGAGRQSAIDLANAEDIEFDGVTVFGGWPGLHGQSTKGLRIVNCAFRGLGSAPWESRASMKYRGKPHYVLVAGPATPMNEDWEIAQSEFTDGHDFALLRFVRNLRFHHNYVDNFNDDGLEMGPLVRDQVAWIFCNRISRCLLTLTQHGDPPNDGVPPETELGSGIYIFRNVFDLRQPTYGSPPREGEEGKPATDSEVERMPVLCGDHGSPIWSQYYFYQNTVLRRDRAWRDYYGFGLGNMGLAGRSKRRVFNNIFVQAKGLPGLVLWPKPDEVDMQVDANLFWATAQGPAFQGDLFAKVRASAVVEASKKQYPPGWAAHDVFADPQFVNMNGDGKKLDLRLQKGSAAIDAGVPVPGDWPDPLRSADKGKPDIGALPLGAEPWRVGVNGRLPLFPNEPTPH